MLESIGLIGGICAFIFFVFSVIEKRLESKIDTLSTDVNRIANELREERRSKDYLYKFVMDYVNKREEKQ